MPIPTTGAISLNSTIYGEFNQNNILNTNSRNLLRMRGVNGTGFPAGSGAVNMLGFRGTSAFTTPVLTNPGTKSANTFFGAFSFNVSQTASGTGTISWYVTKTSGFATTTSISNPNVSVSGNNSTATVTVAQSNNFNNIIYIWAVNPNNNQISVGFSVNVTNTDDRLVYSLPTLSFSSSTARSMYLTITDGDGGSFNSVNTTSGIAGTISGRTISFFNNLTTNTSYTFRLSLSVSETYQNSGLKDVDTTQTTRSVAYYIGAYGYQSSVNSSTARFYFTGLQNGATGVRIFKDGSNYKDFSSSDTNLTYDVGGFSNGNTYSIIFEAFGYAAGENQATETYSFVFSFTELVIPVPSIAVTTINATTLRVSWGAFTNDTNFVIVYWTNNGVPSNSGTTRYGANTYYDIGGLTAGTTISDISIRAYSADGTAGSISNTASGTTTPLYTITNVSGTAPSVTSNKIIATGIPSASFFTFTLNEPKTVTIVLIGAGGGGGGTSTFRGGGGGGNGEFKIFTSYNLTVGTYAVAIYSGALGGVNNQDGGTAGITSFGNIFALGGSGGKSGNASGTGGVGINAGTTYSGGAGGVEPPLNNGFVTGFNGGGGGGGGGGSGGNYDNRNGGSGGSGVPSIILPAQPIVCAGGGGGGGDAPTGTAGTTGIGGDGNIQNGGGNGGGARSNGRDATSFGSGGGGSGGGSTGVGGKGQSGYFYITW